jgi:hypothetical protein
MFAIFHLIFEFLRISFLSLLYGASILLILKGCFKNFKFKKRYLIPIIPLIFISLFVWRFSYWRNNAFGDNGYVPLNKNYYLHDIDVTTISLNTKLNNNSKIGFTTTGKLYLEEKTLYVLDNNKYHIFYINEEKIHKNLTRKEFESRNGNINKLMSISEFHSDYWNIWLILLL